MAVTTRTLRNDGQYNVSYQLFDSLLRARQTQTPAPGGGRLVTDTFYNTRGQVTKANDEYYNGSAPSTALLAVADNQIPGQTVTTYDGADRVSAEIFRALGVERWRTTTTYGGDRVNVDPPAGETATTTITDARDRTTELRQYTGGAPSGAFDATRYAYTPDGQLQTITDPAGNMWQRHYDLRGRLVQVDDPDTGASTKNYDDLDRVTTATDARGKVLAYAYDALDRPTETHDGSLTGPLVGKQVYDTVAKGQLTSSTRYVGINAYTSAVTGYTDTYQPTGTSVTIPAAEGAALAMTYTVSSTYNLDGTVNTTTLPAVGGLLAETLTYGYNELGMLTTLSSNLGTYVNATTWSKLGAVLQRRYGNIGSRVIADFTYEDGTNRLQRAKTDVERATDTTQSDIAYSYDDAGNITRVADTPPAATAPSDTQCYHYDYLRRLTEAWTATDNCAAAASLAVLGGPAPYWHSYAYDTTGNRTSETQHAAAGNTVRTYAYALAGQPHPHALTSVTQQSPAGTTTAGYGYDAVGDTTARPGQTLSWDTEGNLASVSTAAGTTSFLYNAEGSRLLRRDPNATTVYIGETEIKLAKVSGVVTATRYYSDGTGTIAVRTFDNRLYWQIDDQNGTAGLSIDATTLAVTHRRFTPFGAPRGSTVAWKGERGFVDGVIDATTGLTHLGAREYDPSTGRFVSVDPIIDPNDPQQLNGYAYANNSPVTFSDADGMLVNCGPDGFRCGMDPNTDRNTGHYIGPKPKKAAPQHHSSSSSSHVPVFRQPDGGGYAPYRPASNPRAHRHYYQLPDGGYEPSHVHYRPYRPAVRPKPKPSLWQRVRHVAAEVSGVNAIRRCVTGHQVGDCVDAAMSIVSYVPVVGTAARVSMIAVEGARAASAARAARAAYRVELAARADRAAAELQQATRARPQAKLEQQISPWERHAGTLEPVEENRIEPPTSLTADIANWVAKHMGMP